MARRKIEAQTVPMQPNEDERDIGDCGLSQFDQYLSEAAVPRGPDMSPLQIKAMSRTEDERREDQLAKLERWAGDGDWFKDAIFQNEVAEPGSSTFMLGKKKL